MTSGPLIIALMLVAVGLVFDVVCSNWIVESATDMEVWREGNRQMRFVLLVKGLIVMTCIGSATTLAVLS